MLHWLVFLWEATDVVSVVVAILRAASGSFELSLSLTVCVLLSLGLQSGLDTPSFDSIA